MKTARFSAALIVAVVVARAGADAQVVRNYDVIKALVPPIIDGFVDPANSGEWQAASPPSAGFRQLGTGDPSVENVSFRALWDDDYLYLLVKSNRTFWALPGNRPISFNGNLDFSVNLYVDPDTDGNGNVNPANGYQIAISQRTGLSSICNSVRTNLGTYLEAHFNTPFGNGAGWLYGGFPDPNTPLPVDFKVAQTLDFFGGCTELRIPWTMWNAQLPNQMNGLYQPFAPAGGDRWWFELGLIRDLTAR